MFIFSRVQVMYIIFSFFLFSENYFIRSAIFKNLIMCNMYYSELGICTKDYFPVCGTNGRTYFNRCLFCYSYKKNYGKFTLAHYGKC
ncbi:seminal plasma acrosin inhibitor A1-like [Meriones unguiculatus]|uniref:seminal plasma acrosin inhibitor A1-like n=1 Tax=Meriones unguiculatus TaxID=10047 RepID=UPI000B4EBA1E|nr:seminal plasma acrosin inhibitor A1-like [Meriones unguiculatus]